MIVKTDLGSEESARRTRFEPTGTISATNTQKAVEEVATDAAALYAPIGADYIVGTSNGTLTAERVATSTTSITVDIATAAQAQFKRAALTGDVTASADSNATTIANDAVTFAKMQNIATNSLIGRDTASSGDPENILLNATLEMDGSLNLQRAALTGDVTASAGSNATTIANDAVSNAKMADMAQSTIKGRAAGAGTGDPTDLTATQATAILDAFTGDSGSGGVKGLVPAPAAGDAAAGKALHANGTWAVKIGGSTGSDDNRILRADGTGGFTAQASAVTIDDSGNVSGVVGLSATSVDIGASDTTLARSAAGKVTIEGNLIAAIADPNADRVLIWDDSAGDYVGATLNGAIEISGTTIRAVEDWGIALSDETTAITTGTNKATFSLPYAITVTSVYATLNTVSSSGAVTVDINEAGTTILSTKLTIDQSEKTSATAATAAVISDASIAANAEIGFDIDGAGSGAKGLKVFIVGYRT